MSGKVKFDLLQTEKHYIEVWIFVTYLVFKIFKLPAFDTNKNVQPFSILFIKKENM